MKQLRRSRILPFVVRITTHQRRAYAAAARRAGLTIAAWIRLAADRAARAKS
jgi:hypothetical protein